MSLLDLQGLEQETIRSGKKGGGGGGGGGGSKASKNCGGTDHSSYSLLLC